jgi:hypothetical protein
MDSAVGLERSSTSRYVPSAEIPPKRIDVEDISPRDLRSRFHHARNIIPVILKWYGDPNRHYFAGETPPEMLVHKNPWEYVERVDVAAPENQEGLWAEYNKMVLDFVREKSLENNNYHEETLRRQLELLGTVEELILILEELDEKDPELVDDFLRNFCDSIDMFNFYDDRYDFMASKVNSRYPELIETVATIRNRSQLIEFGINAVDSTRHTDKFYAELFTDNWIGFIGNYDELVQKHGSEKINTLLQNICIILEASVLDVSTSDQLVNLKDTESYIGFLKATRQESLIKQIKYIKDVIGDPGVDGGLLSKLHYGRHFLNLYKLFLAASKSPDSEMVFNYNPDHECAACRGGEDGTGAHCTELNNVHPLLNNDIHYALAFQELLEGDPTPEKPLQGKYKTFGRVVRNVEGEVTAVILPIKHLFDVKFLKDLDRLSYKIAMEQADIYLEQQAKSQTPTT